MPRGAMSGKSWNSNVESKTCTACELVSCSWEGDAPLGVPGYTQCMVAYIHARGRAATAAEGSNPLWETILGLLVQGNTHVLPLLASAASHGGHGDWAQAHGPGWSPAQPLPATWAPATLTTSLSLGRLTSKEEIASISSPWDVRIFRDSTPLRSGSSCPPHPALIWGLQSAPIHSKSGLCSADLEWGGPSPSSSQEPQPQVD